MKPLRIRAVLAIVWSLLLFGGYWRLFVYANTPGQPAVAHTHWPETTTLQRGLDTATLVVFAHPHCPCSKATIGELARLTPYFGNKVKSIVTFFKPKAQPMAWVKEGLWRTAAEVPDVQVFVDEDGIEAENFGARTSGQVFLYDRDGNLVFHGGITPERGHMGDSDGRLAILTYLDTGRIELASTPVFGCSIRNPERAPTEVTK